MSLQRMWIRRGTTTQWEDIDPVLAEGEFGFDTTLRLLKIGDGTSVWTALPDFTGGVGGDGPAGVTMVRYDGGAWPARPLLPPGWAVMWVNKENDTQPPVGVDGFDEDLDVALVANPIP